jgi:ribosomal protein L19E
MSTISVTETGSATASELSLLSCSSCSRHAWLQDGALLDRDGMLAAVRARLAEAPRPKGGRPKGSGKKRQPAPAAAPVEDDATRRAREMRALLSGFTVHGTLPH